MVNETDAWEERWRRLRTAPMDALRTRVLQATREELCRSASSTAPRWRWQPFVAIAALALLWIHASWSATLDTRGVWEVNRSEELARQTRAVQELLPELSASESRRLVLVMDAGLRTPSYRVLRGR